MSQFDDRQKAHENKFVHEQELEFKIRAKRNKLLAKWAAGKMGLGGEEVESYADKVMKASVDGSANQAIVTTILRDLLEKSVNITEDEIKNEMENLWAVAKEDFK